MLFSCVIPLDIAKVCIISNSFISSKVNSFKYVAGHVMASFSGKKSLYRSCWCSLIFWNCFLKKIGPIIYSQCSLECIIHLRKSEVNWVISGLLFGSAFTCQLPEESQGDLLWVGAQKKLNSMRYTICWLLLTFGVIATLASSDWHKVIANC